MTPFYSANPARLARQLLADLLLVMWCWLSWMAGRTVDRAVEKATAPGTAAAEEVRALSDRIDKAAGQLSDLPVVGRGLTGPLRDLAQGLTSLARTGDAQLATIEQLGQWVVLAVIVVPVAFGLLAWLPPRLNFVRKSLQATSLRRHPGGEQVLALRALVTQSPAALTRALDDPVAAWKSGDPAAVRVLAGLQLREHGVRRTRS